MGGRLCASLPFYQAVYRYTNCIVTRQRATRKFVVDIITAFESSSIRRHSLLLLLSADTAGGATSAASRLTAA